MGSVASALARSHKRGGKCFAWLILIMIAQSAVAESLDHMQQITDSGLKECVLEQWQEGQALRKLKCHSKGIENLKGLEVFSELEELSLFNNEIEQIDATLWPALKLLNIAKNPIKTLSINHAKLRRLYAFSSLLEDLRLSTPNLELLKANNNHLTAIHLLTVPKLAKLDLFNNKLEIMSIAPLVSCKHLDVRNNPMPDSLYDQMDQMRCLVLHDGNAEDWQ